MRFRRYLAAFVVPPLALGAAPTACSSTATSRPDASAATRDASASDASDDRADAPIDTSAKDAPSDRSAGDAADAGHGDAGPPELTSLQVHATDASTGDELVPPFSADAHDYYVRCGNGSTALTISMTASPGAMGQLTRPTTTKPQPKQTVSLDVTPGQAMVAVATRGAASTEYWVRCLPKDFPHVVVTPHPEAGTPTPGYYLLGDAVPGTGLGGYAVLLDQRGVPIWYAPAPLAEVFNVDDVIPGAISFSEPFTYEVHFLDPPSTKQLKPIADNDHELRVLADGHYLVASTPAKTGVDLTGLSIGSTPLGPNMTIVDCELVEFDPKTGKAAWTWTASDHLDPVQDSTWPELTDGGDQVDVFHCNSIDVDEAGGTLLVSGRNMDSIFDVDKSTGKILWKMGGASYTMDGAEYVPVKDPFLRQHDARFQPGWGSSCSGGQISLFDDETGTTNPARAAVYDVRFGRSGDGGADAGCARATRASLAWQYAPAGPNAEDMGSFRILPDGSRVIDWGQRFTDAGAVAHPTAIEVDLAGADLLDIDLNMAGPSVSYRTVKIPLSTFDLESLRNAAGM